MARKGFPTAQVPEVEPEEMTAMIEQTMTLATWQPIDTKSPEEIDRRCRAYFQYCADHEIRPFIEGLSLSLGVTRQTVWGWAQEQSKRGEIIRRYKQLIITLLEQWHICGKLNPASAIFLTKNLGWNYHDSVTIEPVNKAPVASMTTEEIRKQIEEDIPIDTEPIEIMDMRE